MQFIKNWAWDLGLGVLLLGFLGSSFAVAAPLRVEDVPEPLKPWVSWVRWDHPEATCPYLMDSTQRRECAWSSPLVLSLGKNAGGFQQPWEVFAPAWVALPGDQDFWPQGITVNGAAAKVFTREDRPFLYLTEGKYNIAGIFTYLRLPESFPIPRTTGVLRLSREGQEILFPQVDANSGMVWLKREGQEESKENRLELRVHRKLIDDIPFTLVTQLTLNVSGQSRELVLPRVLLQDFLPLSIVSPVPARIEENGDLRLQVKPGEWRVEITGRHQGPVSSLTLPKHEPPWPKDEVWVFVARNDLRLVWVDGVPSIDPQQTTLPDAWKQLPAYRMSPGDTLNFVEKRRGDSDPAPDQLSLFRQWWLDFDGGGFTLNDAVNGTLRRSWRLEMNKPIQLGRISVDGQDQFITTLPGQDRQGIEVRQGQIQVSADSRLNDGSMRVPALGWNHNFQKVSGELNLPPGWDLFSVSGADRVQGTWVESWTLLDIFLVMILALTFFKLFGWKWGLISLLTFVLTFPESGAPRWVWLALVVGVALLKLLSKGKLFFLLRLYRLGVLLILLITVIPFMIKQIRVGIYPALEHPYEVMTVQLSETKPNLGRTQGYNKRGKMPAQPQALNVAPQDAPMAEEAPLEQKVMDFDSIEGSSGGYDKNRDNFPATTRSLKKAQQIQQRPGAKVQTGPGLPRWEWNRFVLEWNGPVQKGQDLFLVLMPPWLNLVLAFLRVGLLAILILGVMEISKTSWKSLGRRKAVLGLLVLLASSGLLGVPTAIADIPSTEMLTELGERLSADPECFPNCAVISHMEISIQDNTLNLRLQVSSDFGAAVPLPGGLREWTPTQVALDGQSAGLLREADGVLWMQIPAGAHQLLLGGRLPERETLALPLPMKPQQVTFNLPGWSVEGLDENGVPESSLQLIRQQGQSTGESAAFQGTSGLVPFVRVERELVLGLNWEVVTRVVRISPPGVPVVLEIPLLAGESVITPGIRVEEGNVLVNMAANAGDISWRSVLQESSEIRLQAPKLTQAMEQWSLDVSPVWHVEFSGIPRIHPEGGPGVWLPQWRPWPGEALAIQVIRPEGVIGKTLTLDQSLLQVTPGLRFTEFALGLRLRSSLGGQQVLTLPAGAELQEIKIDGKVQPIRLEQNKLTLPIHPGSQLVNLRWQQAGGIGLHYQIPEIQLGTDSVNAEIQIQMPQNRWTLFAWGPRMGPAVMFWSLLVVLFLFAFALSRLGWTPLNTWQWLLLGVGISQFPEFPVFASVFIAGWLLFVGYRERSVQTHPLWFDTRQILLVGYTFFAILALFAAIHQGLLGLPEMQIAGNGSSHRVLRWFQDRTGEGLPRPWVISVPLYYYRLAMLAWALWIALSLIKWLKWTWGAFNKDGAWRPLGILKKKA